MESLHEYELDLEWNHDRKGTLISSEFPLQIEVATPPDFPKGMPGIWSPEHLFIAAINSCLMTTFLAISENSKLEYTHFSSHASGKVDKVDGKYQVTEITLKPVVTIPEGGNKEKAIRIIEMSEKNCLIANSVRTTIHLEPQVNFS
jgi:peroxiredoxin-like protein